MYEALSGTIIGLGHSIKLYPIHSASNYKPIKSIKASFTSVETLMNAYILGETHDNLKDATTFIFKVTTNIDLLQLLSKTSDFNVSEGKTVQRFLKEQQAILSVITKSPAKYVEIVSIANTTKLIPREAVKREICEILTQETNLTITPSQFHLKWTNLCNEDGEDIPTMVLKASPSIEQDLREALYECNFICNGNVFHWPNIHDYYYFPTCRIENENAYIEGLKEQQEFLEGTYQIVATGITENISTLIPKHAIDGTTTNQYQFPITTILLDRSSPLFSMDGNDIHTPITKAYQADNGNWYFQCPYRRKDQMKYYFRNHFRDNIEAWTNGKVQKGNIQLVSESVLNQAPADKVANHQPQPDDETKDQDISDVPSPEKQDDESVEIDVDPETIPWESNEAFKEAMHIEDSPSNTNTEKDTSTKDTQPPPQESPTNEAASTYQRSHEYQITQTLPDGTQNQPICASLNGRLINEEQMNAIIKAVEQQCQRTFAESFMKTMSLLAPKEKIQTIIDKHEEILKSINEIEVSIKSLPTTVSTLGSSNDATNVNETITTTESDPKKQKTGSYASCFNPPETPEPRNTIQTPSSYSGPVKGYFEACQRNLDTALSTIADDTNRDTEHIQTDEPVHTQQDESSEQSTNSKSYAGAVKSPTNDNTTETNEDKLGSLQKLCKSPTQPPNSEKLPSTPNTKGNTTEEVPTPGYRLRNRQPPKPPETTATSVTTTEEANKSTQKDDGWKLAPHRGSKSKK
jgi:hypothetical protein